MYDLLEGDMAQLVARPVAIRLKQELGDGELGHIVELNDDSRSVGVA